MKSLLSLLLLCFAFGCTSAAAIPICSSYLETSDWPRPMDSSSFRKTQFGTLGLNSSTDRYLAFTSTGCYDLSGRYPEERGKSEIKFFLNSTQSTVEASYFRAAVTKLYSEILGGEPKFALKVIRNKGKRESQAGWWKALEGEENYLAGSVIDGGNFDIVHRGYRSPQSLDVGEIGGYSALDLKGSAHVDEEWHALVGNLNKAPPLPQRYRVNGNTRTSINDIFQYVRRFSEYAGGVNTKIYLNKFVSSPTPSLRKDILSISRADCIYIDYRISDGDEIPISHSNEVNILVLRMDISAEC